MAQFAMKIATTPAPAEAPGIALLLEMLTYQRPAGSKTERRFVKRFVDDALDAHVDGYGNRWHAVGDAPSILWSCHTDSVHKGSGRQQLRRSGDMVHSVGPDVLGADCAAGVWLMREMIAAKVPGLYVFHRDEEIGGLGSRWVSLNAASYLEGITAAIAFDRKSYGSVITHQGSRTASDAFADSVAAILGNGYAPDDTGLFTDTANYTDIIGECSNISVGYHKAHTNDEHQDLAFIAMLRDRIIAADWSRLVIERKPGEVDQAYAVRYAAWANWDEEDDGRGGMRPANRWEVDDEDAGMADLVERYPDDIASLLDQLGYSVADIRAFLCLD